MCSELALVGHTQRTSPLFLLNRLELVVFKHVHIEGLSEADPLTIPNSLLDPTVILLISILQWHVLLFNYMFSSCKISIEAWLLEFVKLAYITLIKHF